ncbi:MAG: thiamine phosphate synthase, partial [Candidatus Limisoma sp.]|nr:thiamine phosphate synthase [Candidatus Limisoma sp.]
CKEADCILIIDDYPDIAKELELDGVHLGKNDMSPTEARELLGEEYIIGATANTFDDIEALRHLDIDYIGLGPYRFTATKQRLSPVLGIDGYRRIMQQMKDASFNIPVVAIGGITYDDIPSLMDSGVRGIAVSGSLINADNTTAETQKMITLLEEIIQKKLQ